MLLGLVRTQSAALSPLIQRCVSAVCCCRVLGVGHLMFLRVFAYALPVVISFQLVTRFLLVALRPRARRWLSALDGVVSFPAVVQDMIEGVEPGDMFYFVQMVGQFLFAYV